MLKRPRPYRSLLHLERLEDRTVPAAPVNSFPGTQTVIEETALVFSAANGNGLSFTDADGPGPYQVELVVATNPPSPTNAGSLTVANTGGVTITGNGTNSLTILGSFADVHTALDTLTLTPSINLEGQIRLVFETHDNAAGGQADTDFININVTPNQSPTNIRPGTQTTALNTPLPFSNATGNALSVTDPDGPGLFQVELNLVDTATPPVAAGILSVSSISGLTVSGNNTNALVLVGSLANVNAGLNTLVYHPATGYTGQARLVLESQDSTLNPDRSDTDFVNINVVLDLSPSNVTLSAPGSVNENGQITLNGTFTNPDGDAHTVVINFGDGSTPVTLNLAAGASSFSTTHTYLDDAPSGTSSDVKTITATVSDGVNNAQDTHQITVNNVAPSDASVAATPTIAGGVSVITVNFTDPGTLDPHLIDIDFGDGQSQSIGFAPGLTSVQINHTYTNPGTFTISVVVNDDDLGSAPQVQTTVSVANPVPVVTPPPNQGTDEGQSATFLLGAFTDANNSGNYTVTVNWGDGTLDTVFNQAAAGNIALQDHAFAQDGVFTVTITVDDADGTSAPVSFQTFVSNVLPVRTPPVTQSALAGISQLFNLGSFIDPGDDAPWGVVVNWGDGTPNTTFQVNSPGLLPPQSHTYATNGDFTIVVNVSDDDGTQATTSLVTVANPLPIVTPPVPQTSTEGSSTQFLLGAFTDANNSGNYTVTVNWGDGTPNTVFNQDNTGAVTFQNHTFAQDGSFTVTVTVTDVDGSSTPVSFQANVSNVLPTAVDSPDQFAVATIAQSFDLGSFSDPGDDAPWTITVNWGDGSPNGNFTVNSPGVLPTLTHAFATAGTFNVVVTVNDDDGFGTSDYLVTVIPPEAHILGNVFRDFNRDGSFNTTDRGQSGVVVFADRDGDGVLDANEPTATTDLQGNYDLTVGFEGAVHVRQVVPEGFTQTTSDPASVNVNFGDTVSVALLGLGRIVKPVVAVAGRTGNQPFVQVRDVDGTLRFSFTPYATVKTALKDVRLATGDVNDDGIEDIFAVPGPGIAGAISIFSGADGQLLRVFPAFSFPYTRGLSVAAGDVNGDGVADVWVGTDPGAGPVVRVFDGATTNLLKSFTPANATQASGVRVAAGDVNGDGAVDIITTPGLGNATNRIRVMAFDALSGSILQNYVVAKSGSNAAQIGITAGDLDGDGRAETLINFTKNGRSELLTFSDGVPTSTAAWKGSAVQVAAKDLNGDGIADLLFAGSAGQLPRIAIKDGSSGLTLLNALILSSTQKKGLVIA
jgi:hypothetical protein